MVASRSACVLRPETNPEPRTASRAACRRGEAACVSSSARGGAPARRRGDDVEHVALEIRRLGDVHRRAAGGARLGGRAHPVAPVRKNSSSTSFSLWRAPAARSQPMHFAIQPASTLPKLPTARRTTPLVARLRRREVALEVVDDWATRAPVDRVHGADAQPALELEVVRHALHQVLAVVEHALDGDVEDVGVRERVHLRRWKRSSPVRRQHEDVDALRHASRTRPRAGCRRGGPRMFSRRRSWPARTRKAPEQLHRHVLKASVGPFDSSSSATPAPASVAARSASRRCRAGRAVDLRGVGRAAKPLDVRGGMSMTNLPVRPRQDRIRQSAPAFELGAADPRIRRRQVQPPSGASRRAGCRGTMPPARCRAC